MKKNGLKNLIKNGFTNSVSKNGSTEEKKKIIIIMIIKKNT